MIRIVQAVVLAIFDLCKALWLRSSVGVMILMMATLASPVASSVD
jgi:hypothetical protein